MSHLVNIITAGQALEKAKKVLIMVHGRGGTATEILHLSTYLKVDGYALLAPQAANYTWYPYSFMAARERNEPWLTSAIQVLADTVQQAQDNGVKTENIYFFGFSQGACLILEYLAQHANRYGGAAAIIGGLIGEEIDTNKYQGDFGQMPLFIGTSDPDPHVPLQRVQASVAILKNMNANVQLSIYPNFEHSVNQDEIAIANTFVFG